MAKQYKLDRDYRNWVTVTLPAKTAQSHWPSILLAITVGYLAMSRSFAYLGFPPASLYLGELAIAAFLVSQPHVVFDRWLRALVQAGPLGPFAIVFSLSLLYGASQVVHGINSEYPLRIAVQSFAFHYYPICFFIGLWAAAKEAFTLRRLIRVAAWVNGIYGLLYLVALGNFPIALPGAGNVSLFGQPAGSAVVVLGLLSLEERPVRVLHLLLLNLFVMLGLQVRAEFAGFALGLVLWVSLTRQFGRFLVGCGAVGFLLAAGIVADFRMPAPYTRGGEISTREIVGRVLAPIDPELASEYTPNVRMNAGTAEWRIIWWRAIWDTVNSSTETSLFGEGYGYPLSGLIGMKVEDNLRTPHNVFFYAFGYGGWMGVTIFLALQATIVRILVLSRRNSGSPIGLVLWAAMFSGAFFQNFFETPYGAIPFYLMTGLAAAPAFVSTRRRIQTGTLAIWTTAARVRLLA